MQNQESQLHMKRSFSVPVNVKNPSLRRLGSTGGVIRVVPVTPHEVEACRSFPNDITVGESGMYVHCGCFDFLLLLFLLPFCLIPYFALK